MSTFDLSFHLEIFFRLFLAAALGGFIGWERERKNWFAGLRTHLLVCVGSTLLMIVSQHGFSEVLKPQFIVLDPARVAAQVVGGIGFLGAGTILFLNNKIRGLTTAASLWAGSAVGLAVGGGLYLAAIATTLLILLILAGVKPLKTKFFHHSKLQRIKIWSKEPLTFVFLEKIATKSQTNCFLRKIELKSEAANQVTLLSFQMTNPADIFRLVDYFNQLPSVEKVEINGI